MALIPTYSLDEPSVKFRPYYFKKARRFNQWIEESLGISLIVVTHELAYLRNADIYILDVETKVILAEGKSENMINGNFDPKVKNFSKRGLIEQNYWHCLFYRIWNNQVIFWKFSK